MAKIANVQAEGNTIRIHQKEPDATLPALLSDRPGMIVNPATFEALAADDIPVGSGQLTVTKQQPGVSISFAKHGGHRNADTIKVANVDIPEIGRPPCRERGSQQV